MENTEIILRKMERELNQLESDLHGIHSYLEPRLNSKINSASYTLNKLKFEFRNLKQQLLKID